MTQNETIEHLIKRLRDEAEHYRTENERLRGICAELVGAEDEWQRDGGQETHNTLRSRIDRALARWEPHGNNLGIREWLESGENESMNLDPLDVWEEFEAIRVALTGEEE
jgi:hypothetical protein